MLTHDQHQTYTRSCHTCGWAGSYTSPGVADHALRRHSCDLFKERAAATARNLSRMAAVDRTPKPCGHPVADHQHGTYAAYVLDGCRCLPCAAARSEADRARTRSQAYGRYDRYTDPAPVIAHLRHLAAAGMGSRRVAEIAEVSRSTVQRLTGTNPPGRILSSVANRLLCVEPSPADGACVDGGPTRIRLRALVALGHSMISLARELGMGLPALHVLICADGQVTFERAQEVVALYERLAMTAPPTRTRHERASATRAKNMAAARQWAPPLDVNEDLMDEPGYTPTRSLTA